MTKSVDRFQFPLTNIEILRIIKTEKSTAKKHNLKKNLGQIKTIFCDAFIISKYKN